jgi:steroid delta-isomerase-like uncharacterized protein
MSATAPPVTSNADVIRWSFEMLNRRDLTALRQLWTDDTVERFPDRVCRGADEIARYFEQAFAGVPDWNIEIVDLAEDGDHVFVQWRLTGTHAGPLLGIAPTGKRVSIDGIDHFTLRDGRVASNFVVIDQLQYARQIGMLPADGSAADRAMKAAFNLRQKIGRGLRR